MRGFLSVIGLLVSFMAQADNQSTFVDVAKYPQYVLQVETNSVRSLSQDNEDYTLGTFRLVPSVYHRFPEFDEPVSNYVNEVVVHCSTQLVGLISSELYSPKGLLIKINSRLSLPPPHDDFTPVKEIVKFLCKDQLEPGQSS